MSRQEANKNILSILEKAVDKCPDLRFGQLLIVYEAIVMEKDKVVDPFYEESVTTLHRMANRIC